MEKLIESGTLPLIRKNKEGKVYATVHYLEMFSNPQIPKHVLDPSMEVQIMQAKSITLSFYRYLYDTVGEPWLWLDRRKLNDAELAAIVRDPEVEIYVIYVKGVPAGFAELDKRTKPDIEIGYFGIMPEFIGMRIGHYFLGWIVEKAWSYNPRRFWVHTCTLDHPKALSVYKKCGFVEYKTEDEWSDDPWTTAVYPENTRRLYRFEEYNT
eukprot:TRINITY_DN5447_c0_g1_i1.p1 TRINITY_DN5447_c0_g1~~TRINITY_DN5447_c0_g1_i1.p1  ORF type:complete len:218 (-),score=13.47 TRINITY_DN5447_c0_g1_i1:9-638(-)